MSEAKPYTKAQQLGSQRKRYRRKVASPKQWQQIIAAKIGPCRCCGSVARNGRMFGRIQFHHLIPRDFGGDDVADNIVPLCLDCHGQVTGFGKQRTRQMLSALTDAEYAYAIEKVGEGFAERIYGVEFER